MVGKEEASPAACERVLMANEERVEPNGDRDVVTITFGTGEISGSSAAGGFIPTAYHDAPAEKCEACERGSQESFTTPEIEQKGIEEDSDEDGLLQLDGAELLMCRNVSNRSNDEVSLQTSSAQWQDPGQGVIIVDWDDTLFPTTWLSEKPKFRTWQRGWSVEP
eukprot:g7106.t1